MQIDFHHTVTYLVARLAGFGHPEATTIAHSAQYVDDATNAGTVQFDNGAQYTRIASAHKMLDYKNMDNLADHLVWLPFHFLPGNNGEPAPAAPQNLSTEQYLERCVTRPNSPVAQEMMKDVLRRQDRPYALHRLGIASHVYVDTWAHQGFVGYPHPRNRAKNIRTPLPGRAAGLRTRLEDLFGDVVDNIAGRVVGDVLPLGHGAVLSFPDQPCLVWSYTNGLGEAVKRDNPSDFSEAARQLFQCFKRYRDYPQQGEAVFAHDYPLPQPAFDQLDQHLRSFTDENGDHRHAQWLAAFKAGVYGFTDCPSYVAKGVGSWKHQALGTTEAVDVVSATYPYQASFLSSDWKHFHDALQIHRLHILNELLPRFGLTAA